MSTAEHIVVNEITGADLARTLAAIAAPLGGPARKDPPYDGHCVLDWEGVHLRVPYWIALLAASESSWPGR